MNSCGILEENQGKFVLSIPLSCKWMSFSFFGFNLCAYFTLVYFFTINAQICACVCIFFFFFTFILCHFWASDYKACEISQSGSSECYDLIFRFEILEIGNRSSLLYKKKQLRVLSYYIFLSCVYIYIYIYLFFLFLLKQVRVLIQ